MNAVPLVGPYYGGVMCGGREDVWFGVNALEKDVGVRICGQSQVTCYP